MENLLIKDVMVEGETRHVTLSEGRIQSIFSKEDLPLAPQEGIRVLEGRNCALLPAFVNGHCHSPMSLLRGYADDMALHPWLSEKIWPAEARYREEDFINGYRLAFLEMIKTGTAFFNEMYFRPDIGLEQLQKMGLRGAINQVFMEAGDSQRAAVQKESCLKWFDRLDRKGLGEFCGLAPHSVYTVSLKTLRWIADFAEKNDLKVHIHLSETQKENEDCLTEHGMTPTALLEKAGLLSPRLSVAHGLWLSSGDIELLAENNCKVVHNPASNMKLASGPALNYRALKEAGVGMILGTDGCSSGNNLDMTEQMKLAALLQKQQSGDPTLLTTEEIFHMATRAGADFWGTGGGVIKPGATADLMLINLNRPDMTPCHHLLSNLVYSTTGDAVDSLIVHGRVIMEHRKVAGEEKILRAASESARFLAGKESL